MRGRLALLERARADDVDDRRRDRHASHRSTGAREFLDALRERTQVIILSDTFEQFGAPLMRQLGMPTMLCHQLLVVDDRIVDYQLRMPDQKRHAVRGVPGAELPRRRRPATRTTTRRCSPPLTQGFWFHAPDGDPRAVPAVPGLRRLRRAARRGHGRAAPLIVTARSRAGASHRGASKPRSSDGREPRSGALRPASWRHGHVGTRRSTPAGLGVRRGATRSPSAP